MHLKLKLHSSSTVSTVVFLTLTLELGWRVLTSFATFIAFSKVSCLLSERSPFPFCWQASTMNKTSSGFFALNALASDLSYLFFALSLSMIRTWALQASWSMAISIFSSASRSVISKLLFHFKDLDVKKDCVVLPRVDLMHLVPSLPRPHPISKAFNVEMGDIPVLWLPILLLFHCDCDVILLHSFASLPFALTSSSYSS